VIEFLSNFKDNELEIYLYSPSLTDDDAAKLGVKKSSPEEIFKDCDIISSHIANNPQTFGFFSSKLFELMGEQTVFINSGRGQQVVESDLADAMRKRPRSCALLDVTYPEPPDDSCPFFSVSNIFLNPHIAGSQNNELERMVNYVLDDAICLKNGKELKNEITLAALSRLA
jgi:phosphoglycerate dehydrogenase-like enzyme